ncbi:MAG: hypothetical protein ACRDVG_13805 [Jatrophihabitantaceae bacterium]
MLSISRTARSARHRKSASYQPPPARQFVEGAPRVANDHGDDCPDVIDPTPCQRVIGSGARDPDVPGAGLTAYLDGTFGPVRYVRGS